MKNILKTTMLLFLLIGFCGCEEEEPMHVKKTYINKEVQVDGILDPMNNIDWLKAVSFGTSKYAAVIKFRAKKEYRDLPLERDFIFLFNGSTFGSTEYGSATILETDESYSPFLCYYDAEPYFAVSEETSLYICNLIDSIFDNSNIPFSFYSQVLCGETRRQPPIVLEYCEDADTVFHHATNIEVLACQKIITIENEK